MKEAVCMCSSFAALMDIFGMILARSIFLTFHQRVLCKLSLKGTYEISAIEAGPRSFHKSLCLTYRA